MADSVVSDSYRPLLLYDSYALRGLYLSSIIVIFFREKKNKNGELKENVAQITKFVF